MQVMHMVLGNFRRGELQINPFSCTKKNWFKIQIR